MKTKMLALGLAALAMFVEQTATAATTVDGSITVTPIGTLSLTLAATYYAFGNVDVGFSTNSTTTQVLSNVGSVGATVQKSIVTDAAGWTSGQAAAANVYVLYAAATALSVGPGDAGFSNAGTKFANSSALNNLTGTDGVTPTALAPTSGTINVWYRMDMPTTSSSQAARTVTVRYTGTAQ